MRITRKIVVGGMLVAGMAQGTLLLAQSPFPSEERQETSRPGVPGQLVTLRLDSTPLAKAIELVAAQVSRRVMYTREQLPKTYVTVQLAKVPADEAFSAILRGTGLEAVLPKDGPVLIRTKAGAEKDRSQQSGTITGRVIDSSGRKGIGGVTVTLVGTSLSATTQTDGQFHITRVPVGTYSLAARLLGYASRTTVVKVDTGKSVPVMITLEQTTTTLSEVVTTAMGAQQRVTVGSDIAKINADSLRSLAPVRSVTDLIAAAQVPGVLVTRSSGDPGAPSRIRMRGIGSISQSNDPVLIVDGVWVSSASSTDEGSSLDAIDPASIETIEIVRGPSAAALYGQDAANGVIIITTKRGKPNVTRWTLSMNNDVTSLPYDVPPSFTGYGRTVFGDYIVACGVKDVAAKNCIQDYVVTTNATDPFISKEGKGRQTTTNMSLSGGLSQLQYAISGSHLDEIGVKKLAAVDAVRLRRVNLGIPPGLSHPTQLQRTQFTTNVTLQPSSSVNAGIQFRVSQQNLGRNELPFFTVGLQAAYPDDTVSVTNGSGRILYSTGTEKTTTGVLGISGEWRPSKWLASSLNTGLERTNMGNDRYSRNFDCVKGNCLNGTGSNRGLAQQERSVYTARLRLWPQTEIGVLRNFVSIRPSIGMDFRRDEGDAVNVDGRNLALGSQDIGTAASFGVTGTEQSRASAGWSLSSTFGIARRLYFDMGLRQDLGSAINKSANYPKLSGSWLISDESFFPGNSLIPTLRLRAAFGYAAVQPDVVDVLGRYIVGQAFINGQLLPTVALNDAGNSQLRPERAFEIETGFDADLLGDRVSVGVTMAHKRNQNNLINRTLAPSTGLGTGTRKENIAAVINRTLEVSFTGRVVDHAALFWTITTNMTVLDNRVARLGSGVSPFGESDARIVEGYPVSGVWSRPVLGYNDNNSDGVLSADEIVLGDSLVYAGWVQPRYTAGYSTTMSLWNRKVQLYGSFDFKGGYTQYQTKYDMWGLQDIQAPLAEQAYALIASNPDIGNRQSISELRFTSASITVYAPLPVTRMLRANAASVSFQGSNLGLWTHYRGRDPGVNSQIRGEKLQDNGLLTPPPRRYVLQMSVTF